MIDAQTAAGIAPDNGQSAGAMLKQAREQRGMHIALLASMMKVTPKKLEALERDQLDQLPDLAFSRALAQAICRVLKVDAAPILAKFPPLAKPEGLEHATNGLAAPYRERGDAKHERVRFAWLRRPAFWATALILVGAMFVAFAPPSWLGRFPFLTALRGGALDVATTTVTSRPAKAVVDAVPLAARNDNPTIVMSPMVVAPVAQTRAPATSLMGPPLAEPTSQVLVETVHSVPTADAVPSSALSAAPVTVAGLIVVRTKAEAWVDVSDSRGQSMIARNMQAGETIAINGEPPFKVRLGSVPNTELRYRGEPVDITKGSVGNTIRMELR